MNISVKSRAHRCLRDKERYHTFDGTNKKIEDYPVTLEADENPIGVFENIPNQVKDSIIITDKGMHYCFEGNSSKKVRYSDITGTSYPEPDKKRTEEILMLHLRNGESFPLFIKRLSDDQRFNDLFNFMRFIYRVKSDLES